VFLQPQTVAAEPQKLSLSQSVVVAMFEVMLGLELATCNCYGGKKMWKSSVIHNMFSLLVYSFINTEG